MAIKTAYPHLSGDQRGIPAIRLVQAAVRHFAKTADVGLAASPTSARSVRTTGPMTRTGPPGDLRGMMGKAGP